MRTVPLRKVLFLWLLVIVIFTSLSVFAAANSVPQTRADAFTNTIGVLDLVPAECGSLGITHIVDVATGQERGSGSNTMYLGTSGYDTITGKNGSDCILGGGGNDTLSGGQGNDVLIGGPGDDNLDGGPQTDVCYGGTGSNTFNRCESTP